MPNYSGVWTLKEHGVAVKGDRWQPPFDGVSRFLRFGGRPNDVNDIKFVTIDTKGNEVDFGDMVYMTTQDLGNAGSNGHGGLSG